MAEKIKLVQGDTKPQIKVTITDETTEEAVDISNSTPRLKFRAANTTEILTTLTGTVTDGPNGVCIFVWASGDLDVDPGDYEGEVEITFEDETVQSVYDLLKFKLRQDF